MRNRQGKDVEDDKDVKDDGEEAGRVEKSSSKPTAFMPELNHKASSHAASQSSSKACDADDSRTRWIHFLSHPCLIIPAFFIP